MNEKEPGKKGVGLLAFCAVVLGLVFAETGAALALQIVKTTNSGGQGGGSATSSYTVTWLNDDGTVLEVDNDVAHGVTPTYDGNIPSKAAQGLIHYNFNGWNHEVVAANADVTYVATYQTVYNNATVTFDMGGHGSQVVSQSVTYNDYVTRPVNPTAEGYRFVGWYKEPSALIAWNFASDKVTSDVTIYARWKESETFTVTFENNGHGDPVASKTVFEGSHVVNPGAPENYDTVNWEFVGWEDEGGNSWNFEENVVEGDLTLYAQWIGIK